MKRVKPWMAEFNMHKFNAGRRNIAFLLTFEEWLKIWRDSGHLKKRGRGREKYCMSRLGDKGAYEVGNVQILTNAANRAEQVPSEEVRNKQREFMLGNTFSKDPPLEVRIRLSNNSKGNKNRLGKKHSNETKALIGAKSKGRVFSDESRAQMSTSAKDSENRGRFLPGHQDTQETKIKKSTAKKDQWKDPAYRAMMLAARKKSKSPPKA